MSDADASDTAVCVYGLWSQTSAAFVVKSAKNCIFPRSGQATTWPLDQYLAGSLGVRLSHDIVAHASHIYSGYNRALFPEANIVGLHFIIQKTNFIAKSNSLQILSSFLTAFRGIIKMNNFYLEFSNRTPHCDGRWRRAFSLQLPEPPRLGLCWSSKSCDWHVVYYAPTL